ncbi:MAG: outer membrane lipoprotein carrier protein LolA [Kofleriaceae bacterium]
MRALIGIALVALVATPARAQPATVTPAQAAAKVEATYKDAASVTASFTKTQVNATFGMTTITSGTVAFQRPGKMAWDFVDKKKQRDNEFLFDGKDGWMIRHKNKEAVQQSMSATDLPAVIAFLAGSGSLTKDFAIAAPKDKNQLVPGAVVIELTPKAPSASFTSVLLVIDPTSWTVTRSIVFVPSGDQTTYAFANVDTKAKLDAKRFTFDAKKYPLYKFQRLPASSKQTP